MSATGEYFFPNGFFILFFPTHILRSDVTMFHLNDHFGRIQRLLWSELGKGKKQCSHDSLECYCCGADENLIFFFFFIDTKIAKQENTRRTYLCSANHRRCAVESLNRTGFIQVECFLFCVFFFFTINYNNNACVVLFISIVLQRRENGVRIIEIITEIILCFCTVLGRYTRLILFIVRKCENDRAATL